MSLRTILLLCLVLGGGSVFWFSQRAKQGETAPIAAAAATTKILVAAQPTQAGTLLKDVDFKEKDVPTGEVTGSEIVADDASRTEIRGAMLRRYLENGETITKTDILRPKDRGFLAAVLAPGTRAISIPVDATTGAAGLISPGDLVDVILSQEFARGETPLGRRVVAETVLTAGRVIAVDQQIAQGAPTSSSSVVPPNSRVASTVSLQVTPEQAGRVVVAERLGRLTLAVRSIDADPSGRHPNTPGATLVASGEAQGDRRTSTSIFGADVSAALSKDEPAVTPKLRVIQGDSVSDVVFR